MDVFYEAELKYRQEKIRSLSTFSLPEFSLFKKKHSIEVVNLNKVVDTCLLCGDSVSYQTKNTPEPEYDGFCFTCGIKTPHKIEVVLNAEVL
jgi:hypothetical protein